MRNYFTLAGTDSRDFGIYLSGRGTYNSPTREIQFVSVPGRDGDLIMANSRLQNVTVTYPAFMYANFKANIAAFRAFLLSEAGYRRLIDTYNPDEYRMAVFTGPLDVDATKFNNAGQFDITFTVKPQRYLLTGDTGISRTTSLPVTNPTSFACSPLLRVYGEGRFYLASSTFTIAHHTYDYIDIDCETGRSYYGDTALDSYVSLDTYNFPKLQPGSNTFNKMTITQVIITPRWWTV